MALEGREGRRSHHYMSRRVLESILRSSPPPSAGRPAAGRSPEAPPPATVSVTWRPFSFSFLPLFPLSLMPCLSLSLDKTDAAASKPPHQPRDPSLILRHFSFYAFLSFLSPSHPVSLFNWMSKPSPPPPEQAAAPAGRSAAPGSARLPRAVERFITLKGPRVQYRKLQGFLQKQ